LCSTAAINSLGFYELGFQFPFVVDDSIGGSRTHLWRVAQLEIVDQRSSVSVLSCVGWDSIILANGQFRLSRVVSLLGFMDDRSTRSLGHYTTVVCHALSSTTGSVALATVVLSVWLDAVPFCVCELGNCNKQ
jgi:hypothetical protein